MTFLPWFSLSFRATLLASLRHSAMVLYALTLAETALFAANRWHSGIAPLHRSVSQCLQVAVGATPRANRWLGCEIARGARARHRRSVRSFPVAAPTDQFGFGSRPTRRLGCPQFPRSRCEPVTLWLRCPRAFGARVAIASLGAVVGRGRFVAGSTALAQPATATFALPIHPCAISIWKLIWIHHRCDRPRARHDRHFRTCFEGDRSSIPLHVRSVLHAEREMDPQLRVLFGEILDALILGLGTCTCAHVHCPSEEVAPRFGA